MSWSVTGAVAVFGVTTLFSPYQNYYLAKFRTDGSAVWALQAATPDSLRRGLTIAVNGFGQCVCGRPVDADLFWENSLWITTALLRHSRQPPQIYWSTRRKRKLCPCSGGAQPASYQWRLDGTDIVGATNNSLTVTSAIGDPAVVFPLSSAMRLAPRPVPQRRRAGAAHDAAGFRLGPGRRRLRFGTLGLALPLTRQAESSHWFYERGRFHRHMAGARGGSTRHQRDCLSANTTARVRAVWFAPRRKRVGRRGARGGCGSVLATSMSRSSLGSVPVAKLSNWNTTLTNTDRSRQIRFRWKSALGRPAGGSGVAGSTTREIFILRRNIKPARWRSAPRPATAAPFWPSMTATRIRSGRRQLPNTLGVGRSLAGRHQCGYLTGRFRAPPCLTARPSRTARRVMHSSWPNIPAVVISTGRASRPRLYLERPGGRFGPSGGCYWAGAFSGDLVVEGAAATSSGEANTFSPVSARRDLQWLRHLRGRTSSSVERCVLTASATCFWQANHR